MADINMKKLEADLMEEEGFNAHVYLDTVGCQTIGYGRNLRDVGITREEALYLLRNEVALALSALFSRLPWAKDLTEARQRVLVDMIYNMGIAGLCKFTTFLACLRRSEYEDAAKAMLDSKWATQVHGRATRLAKMVVEG